MGRKKIIPCLDIRGERVVKGLNFEGIQDVSDPLELANYYNESGADELVFYDITASLEGRLMFMDLLKQVAKQVSIPLVVGGGISSLDDVKRVIDVGAHKVSINSASIKNPQILEDVAEHFGSTRLVLSVDVKRVDDRFRVFAKGGRENTGLDALEWVVQGEKLGAGELVINSIDTDGVRKGFDLEMLAAIANEVTIPIIASGGAGKMEDFLEVFKSPGVEGGLAASIFHNKEVEIGALKQYLIEQGINVSLGGKKR
ncbi:MAG: imidazole glycerol phosphate synthase subunit HisF [Bacillota bacterium]|nr:imidazole glycerol phosphate synthase subunit HisF [Bacillota bacterium]HHU60362.1 imidazole glycerol phosphate synthase subunit HisF [Natronincola sp.]